MTSSLSVLTPGDTTISRHRRSAHLWISSLFFFYGQEVESVSLSTIANTGVIAF